MFCIEKAMRLGLIQNIFLLLSPSENRNPTGLGLSSPAHLAAVTVCYPKQLLFFKKKTEKVNSGSH